MLLQNLLETVVCVLFRYSFGKWRFRYCLLNKFTELKLNAICMYTIEKLKRRDYNESRNTNENGTSSRLCSLFKTTSAAISPIFLKSVEMVVIPFRIKRFHGVSL